jgi:radical SAM family uncharacterized protein/radical SAM-linked protein
MIETMRKKRLKEEYSMRQKGIQDILNRVELPSRYLGSEINTIKKDPGSVKLKCLLAFPDLYEIGTSHFGIQILYHIINKDPDMMAERVFAPAGDMESQMRKHDIPLTSLESKIPMNQFDIVGFSLLYELNYTNVLNMMSLGRIPFLSKDRSQQDPVVIAGGPCTSNPEPVADFFDAIVIGDGEVVVPAMMREWIAWKKENGNRTELLKRWAAIEGIYIPCFYEVSYDDKGFQQLSVKGAFREIAPDRVRRSVVPELNLKDFPERPIIPFGKPIHDRLRVEVARGCTRGCRFCQAGMIYRPVRERSVKQLLSITEKSLAGTGYEDISLLSLSTGDYSGIVPLMQMLMARCEAEKIAVSFPSLRAGTMTPELMELVKKVRKTGFTMAVEAGSQRLRDVINKNIQREDILKMVADAFGLGWQVIKLYFMIGLPGETQEDLEEMVSLVKEINDIKGPKGRKGKINVSVNTFIPKSHTPFQWAGQLTMEESRKKIEWLKEALRLPKVQVKWQNPENSFLEGLWARGDRQFSKLLLAAYEKGCRFDGWSDHFRFDKWSEAIDDVAIDAEFFVCRSRALDESLVWDHIYVGVEKDFFKKEWIKAMEGGITLDCRDNPCTNCGVCDHKIIKPKIQEERTPLTGTDITGETFDPDFMKTITVCYSRENEARFFGHLELVNIILRAIRRANIPVAYSQGFHPMPKISFDNPLPLGYESTGELFKMRVPANITPGKIKKKLEPELPDGLKITGCWIETKTNKDHQEKIETYEVSMAEGVFSEEMMEKFHQEERVLYTRKNKKGKTIELDIKQAVRQLRKTAPGTLQMVIAMKNGKTIRPGIVLKNVFGMTEEEIQDSRIRKTETAYR